MLRRVLLCLALATLILVTTTTFAFAADWYVDASIGSDSNPGNSPASPFKSITRGTLSAAPGDTVHVAAGLYGAPTTAESFPLVMFQGVLQGAGSSAVTILGTGATPVISGTGIGSSAKIDGFTVTGGSPGLDFTDSELTISNNVVTGNTGGATGGGIHSKSGGVQLLNNVIRGNTATYGGGIVCEDGDVSRIEGNTIEQNVATEGGGGIDCFLDSNPTIVRNVIRDNTAALGGGILSESGSLPHVTETVIQSNSADPTGGGKGGAIVCFSASVLLENCLVTGNSSSDYAISGINSAATRIRSCTIADNSPAGIGRFSTTWTFAFEMQNSILRNAGTEVDPGAVATITYSDVEGGATGAGNIDAEPLFVTAGTDYHLTAASPCVDAGADEVDVVSDLDGTARPYGAGWDMGAYEYAPEEVRSLIGRKYGDAVSDAYLYSYRPTTNYAGLSTMAVGRSSYGEMRILARFPLEKLAGPDVRSAVLHLNRSSGATSIPVRTYRLKRHDVAWSQVTWNQAASGATWAAPGAGAAGVDYWADTYSESTSFADIDVTALAEDAVAAGETSLDLLIVDPTPVSGRSSSLFSSDFSIADLEPSLEVVSAASGAPDLTPPSVGITSPADGAIASGQVAISASATDAESGVARVEFRVDGVLISSATAEPYGATWDASTALPGIHTITATAFDNAGNSASASVTVSVPTPDTTPPTVYFVLPTNGDVVSGTVYIGANAGDSGGSGMSRVEFFVDGQFVGVSYRHMYVASWNSTGATPGPHVIQAVAYDLAGNSTSASVTVYILDTTPPSVSITSPADGALVWGEVAIGATASDTYSGIARVEFAVDGSPLMTDTAEPYSATWDATGATPGVHTITATAYDGAGNFAAATRSVDVSGPVSEVRTLIGKKYGDAALDTYLYAYRPTTNYNALSTMAIGRSSYGEMRVVVRLPLIKLAGLDVTSATLHLSRSSGQTSMPLRAYRLKRADLSWPQATWNQYATGAVWSTPGAGGAGSDYWPDAYCDSTSFTDFDVSTLAKAALAAGETSLDLLIVDPAPVLGRSVSLFTSDFSITDSNPWLEVLSAVDGG